MNLAVVRTGAFTQIPGYGRRQFAARSHGNQRVASLYGGRERGSVVERYFSGQIGVIEVARGLQKQFAIANQKQRRSPAKASCGVYQRVAPLAFVFKTPQPPRDL